MSDIRFEGGFRPRQNHDVTGYEEFTVPGSFGMREYMDKTKQSMLAFSTPAVHDCFGWILGEYLALGKAIISTPILR